MKGLDLAERYFQAFGLPLIERSFPQYCGRIAAGLVGLGSECLGFDDALSRDHDWGGGFCLWLTAADHRLIGGALAALYRELPATFEGVERVTSQWGEGRVGVFETDSFYRRLLGGAGVPETLYDWFRLPENNLAVCTSGRVFHDPLGEFSALRRRLLDFYPDDVMIARVAARCMTAGQAGQYNYLRCLRREDRFAAGYTQMKFCADLMSLIHLVNRRYAPYYKWLLRSTATLPLLGAFTAGRISALVDARTDEERLHLIEELCAAVVSLLQAEGLSDSPSGFLVDHGPAIHDRIADASLRNLNVWAG